MQTQQSVELLYPSCRLRPYQANATTSQTVLPDVNVETLQSEGGGSEGQGQDGPSKELGVNMNTKISQTAVPILAVETLQSKCNSQLNRCTPSEC
jgi:hypothetical protein